MASKLILVLVGGASFLDMRSRRVRCSNMDVAGLLPRLLLLLLLAELLVLPIIAVLLLLRFLLLDASPALTLLLAMMPLVPPPLANKRGPRDAIDDFAPTASCCLRGALTPIDIVFAALAVLDVAWATALANERLARLGWLRRESAPCCWERWDDDGGGGAIFYDV